MRKLVWFAGGFGCACLLFCLGWGGLLPAALSGVLGLLSAALWAALRPAVPADVRRLPQLRRILFGCGRRLTALCLGGVLAFGWSACYSALFFRPAEELAGAERSISATVISFPEETSVGGYSVTLRLDGGPRAPDLLLYGAEPWGTLRPGDRVRCTVRIEASDTLYGEETTFYTAKGVFLLGYCNEAPAADRVERLPLRYWPALCAKELKEGICAAFDEQAAPLAAAITLGDKSGLDEQLRSALNRAGVMHAAVVSGMHISFLVSAIMVLSRGSRRAALCLVPLLLFYAWMAGGTPSAFRAVIMQLALLAGPVLGREADPPSSMALALLVLLLQNPFAAASVSLQLSFAAVAGILLVTGRLNDGIMTRAVRLLRGRKWPVRLCRFPAAHISVSLGAMLFTTPLIALYFGRISIVAPVTNLLVLWAVPILMVAALIIGSLAIFLPGVMIWPGRLFGLLAHYIRAVVTGVGSRQLAALSAAFPVFLIWLLLVYLQIPGWIFAKRKGRQTALSLLCLAAALAAAVGLNSLSVRQSDLTVAALDVGQGAATLLLSGGEAVLVDCGGNGQDSAGDVAADYLAAIGKSRLELLVFTHLDDDHFNGAAQLLSRVEVDRILLPRVETHAAQLAQLAALAREEGAEPVFVTARQTLSFGSAVLTLYPPLGQGTSNEEGLFVLCSEGSFDVLITGDADEFVERMLVKYCALPDIEVLLVGHHGSRSSACQTLLDGTRPELAVISVGYNAYGHPHGETLDRLSASGAKIYRTDEKGTVTIRLKDGMITVS